MSSRLCSMLLFFIMGISINVVSQDKKDPDKVAFYKAVEIRKAAASFRTNDPIRADKLYEEAEQVYPGVFQNGIDNSNHFLGSIRLRNGDVRGGNKAWDDAIKKIQDMPGPFFTGLYTISKSELLRDYYIYKITANLHNGDYYVAAEDIRKALKLDLTKKELQKYRVTGVYLMPAMSLQQVGQLFQTYAFLSLDRQLIKDFQLFFTTLNDEVFIEQGNAYLALLNQDYDQAIRNAKNIEEKGSSFYRVNSRFIQAWTYALQGKADESEEVIQLLLKNVRVFPQMVARLRAINAFKTKDFSLAIKYATQGLKPLKTIGIHKEVFGKFFDYTIRAQALMAVKEYDKAKVDFERALLYNENYEPAITGLAELESAVIAGRITDKAGPVITITEPGLKRGLKIISAQKEVTIRGIASDPSGIHEVTVNGQKLFVQESGNFWGSISLKEGTNQLSVIATDKANNPTKDSLKIDLAINSNTLDNIVPVAQNEGKSYALIIAVQNYMDSNIPSLENPVIDAIKLKLILKSAYNFAEDNISTLFNPTVLDFKKQFSETLDIIQPDDNLIIFYAGHGIWVEKDKKGYWLLTDAKRNDTNTWLSNKLVLDMIAKVPSRHTLLITDACFSGSVFKTRGLGADAPVALREMDNKISRVAITSGNDTEVPDESVFMKYLVKALSENKEKYLTAQKMFITQIIEAVMTETKTEPRYGTLELAGHVGGDYIFTKKN